MRSELINAINKNDVEGVQSLLNTPLLSREKLQLELNQGLLLATENDNQKLVTLFLDHNAEIEYREDDKNLCYTSALERACQRGHTETVRILLERGALVDQADDNVPLILATWEGRNIETVSLLLKYKADVNRKNILKESALHKACDIGLLEMAKFLISSGADVNSIRSSGETPLHCAATYGHVKLTYLLLKNGACVNALTAHYKTPLFLAAEQFFRDKSRQYSDIARILLDHGADANQGNNFNVLPLDVNPIGAFESSFFRHIVHSDVHVAENTSIRNLLISEQAIQKAGYQSNSLIQKACNIFIEDCQTNLAVIVTKPKTYLRKIFSDLAPNLSSNDVNNRLLPSIEPELVTYLKVHVVLQSKIKSTISDCTSTSTSTSTSTTTTTLDTKTLRDTPLTQLPIWLPRYVTTYYAPKELFFKYNHVSLSVKPPQFHKEMQAQIALVENILKDPNDIIKTSQLAKLIGPEDVDIDSIIALHEVMKDLSTELAKLEIKKTKKSGDGHQEGMKKLSSN